ncbi:hypothetical protein [Xanthomonas populi]|uniref:hypothetical protein n=1 Tax=Xanthomonas populi TaxID=53414 RepID=UPI001ABEEA10|nr:hypothetical protein [Xanthomonas populi]
MTSPYEIIYHFANKQGTSQFGCSVPDKTAPPSQSHDPPRSALRFDLFAEASRQHNRDKVGDTLQAIARHIDVGELAGL